jgi:CheY-like chemotaxis protein
LSHRHLHQNRTAERGRQCHRHCDCAYLQELRVAQSAEEAVEVLADWQPDLAILDVGLPKMNGIDLAIALKNSHPLCRVLLFSGYPNTADLLAQAEADGHLIELLAKPIHPTVMLDRAAHLLSPISPEAAKTPAELD